MNGTWILYGRKWGTATGTMSFNGVCLTPIDCEFNDLTVSNWVATDACGNSSPVYHQTIHVMDVTAPAWATAPGALDVTVECSDAAGLAAAQALFPVAEDNCDTNVTDILKVSGAFVPGDCPATGTYTNEWKVTDDCGNTSLFYTQVITV